MFADRVDRPSKLAQLRGAVGLQAIARSTLTAGKTGGAPLHLILLGLVAVWTIGVFFGVGLSSLTPAAEPQISGSVGTGAPRSAADAPLEAAAALLRDKSRGQTVARIAADPVVAIAFEGEPRSLGVEAGTGLPDRKDLEPSQPLPVQITGTRAVAQSAHSNPARERRHRGASGTRALRSQGPRQAIRDLLQRHPGYLR